MFLFLNFLPLEIRYKVTVMLHNVYKINPVSNNRLQPFRFPTAILPCIFTITLEGICCNKKICVSNFHGNLPPRLTSSQCLGEKSGEKVFFRVELTSVEDPRDGLRRRFRGRLCTALLGATLGQERSLTMYVLNRS